MHCSFCAELEDCIVAELETITVEELDTVVEEPGAIADELETVAAELETIAAELSGAEFCEEELGLLALLVGVASLLVGGTSMADDFVPSKDGAVVELLSQATSAKAARAAVAKPQVTLIIFCFIVVVPSLSRPLSVSNIQPIFRKVNTFMQQNIGKLIKNTLFYKIFYKISLYATHVSYRCAIALSPISNTNCFARPCPTLLIESLALHTFFYLWHHEFF